MGRVVHFEVHADDPVRAQAFYAALFGWEFTQFAPMEYWVVKTGSDAEPGIDGGLLRRLGPRPEEGQAVNAYVCTVDVASVDHALEHALSLGGTLAHAKMAIPGVGWLAYAKDPEGNIFGLMQADPNAA